MKYIKAGTYGTGDSVYACDALTGNCTEFHSLFISLARSAGIPSRFAVGAAIPSDRDEGGIDGYHCWAEFYAEGKWWPVDISEANKYTALATYYFGRHPANRIEFTQGRDLMLDPGPSGGPINFLAYPVMEIGDRPAFPKTYIFFSAGKLWKIPQKSKPAYSGIESLVGCSSPAGCSSPIFGWVFFAFFGRMFFTFRVFFPFGMLFVHFRVFFLLGITAGAKAPAPRKVTNSTNKAVNLSSLKRLIISMGLDLLKYNLRYYVQDFIKDTNFCSNLVEGLYKYVSRAASAYIC